MITDGQVLDHVLQSWKSVRIFEAMINTNLTSGNFAGGFMHPDFGNLSASLVVFFAFSVLEDVLTAIRDEGHFVCKRNQLGNQMSASRSKIDWDDYEAVDFARIKRNKLAHEQAVLTRSEAKSCVDLIERQLVSWDILPGPVRATYTLERRPN